MRRILIIGSGGSGKSSFAVKIGKKLGIPVIHLDTLYWKPGWVETPNDEWDATIVSLVQQDRWIMDGNYSRTLDLRLPAADTVIFLDLSRCICLWRVVKRRLLYWNRSRPDITEGCRERLTWEFLKWIWDYPTRTRPRVLTTLEGLGKEKSVVILKSRSEVEVFLTGTGGEARTASQFAEQAE